MFFLLEKFMFYASWYHLDTSHFFSIPPQYIEPIFSLFCLLDTYVNLLKSFSTPSSIPPIDRAPLACFSCVSHVLHFFFLPFMSIAYCFHVFQVGLCFLVLLILFMPVFYLSPVMFFFGFLCPLTIMSKMGRNLSFECYSLGGVTDLGGELHVRGRRNFLM